MNSVANKLDSIFVNKEFEQLNVRVCFEGLENDLVANIAQGGEINHDDTLHFAVLVLGWWLSGQ